MRMNPECAHLVPLRQVRSGIDVLRPSRVFPARASKNCHRVLRMITGPMECRWKANATKSPPQMEARYRENSRVFAREGGQDSRDAVFFERKRARRGAGGWQERKSLW